MTFIWLKKILLIKTSRDESRLKSYIKSAATTTNFKHKVMEEWEIVKCRKFIKTLTVHRMHMKNSSNTCNSISFWRETTENISFSSSIFLYSWFLYPISTNKSVFNFRIHFQLLGRIFFFCIRLFLLLIEMRIASIFDEKNHYLVENIKKKTCFFHLSTFSRFRNSNLPSKLDTRFKHLLLLLWVRRFNIFLFFILFCARETFEFCLNSSPWSLTIQSP